MVAFVVVHARPGEVALGRRIAGDAAFGLLVPAEIEGRQLGEKRHAAIRQVVVNPPGQRAPVRSLLVAVCEPGDHDAGGRALVAGRIAPVPDVAGMVGLVRGTIELVVIAEFVHSAGAIGGTYGDAPEGGL